ncbi:IgGFc-binding protein [Nannocystis pusilla]|uniref:IgGFc-binding protein n=1 Tax=Nannocystis pusilla TaxID=889268 RepID=UPI003B829978
MAKAGDYAEFATDKDFKISADFKIVVSEYFTGGNGGDGDPAMTIAVPIEHYRTHYSFHAPTNYTSNFVNIIAPTDAKITIDGQPVAGFQPIGVTGYSTARVQLSNAGDGDHTITGDKAFGVQVYGYGSNTSYWYPGGL